jgi:ribosomally synthesized peptide (two-chain TOMM family)
MVKLMAFRTTYLRAIAKAWADPQFSKHLIGDPISAMRDYFDFEWPWPTMCNLEIVVPGAGATPSASPGRFEWIGDEWTWSKNLLESLTIYVPLTPPPGEATSEATPAMALADYYRQRSSMFNDHWGETTSLEHRSMGLVTEAYHDGSNDRYAPMEETFEGFEIVLVAAMAKAWKDPDFRQQVQIDSAAALQTIQGYTLPWEMIIWIKNDEKAQWTRPSSPHSGQSSWSFSTENKHTLKLYLPTKPKELSSEPIALAMYNATGAVYPFTCTC